MTNEQVNAIVSAKTRYENAARTNMGAKAAREQLKTVMFNCYPDLVNMLKSDEVADKVNAEEMQMLRNRIISLEADIESLHGALADADTENDELRKELSMLRNNAKQKRTKAVDADGEA